MWNILVSNVSRTVQPVFDAWLTLMRERPVGTGGIVVAVVIMVVMLAAEIAEDRTTAARTDGAPPMRLKW